MINNEVKRNMEKKSKPLFTATDVSAIDAVITTINIQREMVITFNDKDPVISDKIRESSKLAISMLTELQNKIAKVAGDYHLSRLEDNDNG